MLHNTVQGIWYREERIIAIFGSVNTHNQLYLFNIFSSVYLLSRVWLFATPWISEHQASLSSTDSWCLPKPMSTELVMPSNHLILCRPLLLPSIFSSIRVFSDESALCIRWPKYWSFSFNISPSNEHPGLIFRTNWLDLLAVQGTLKSLLQHHSSKASIHKSQQDPLWPTSQNIRNKSKNKQMGPNET